MPRTNREKLQQLLRTLFQFDHADLDFGIYRIMNEKRDEIERFIEHDLLEVIEESLARFQVGDRRELEAQRYEKRAQLGDAAFDEDGRVREEFLQIPIAQEYMKLHRQLRQMGAAEEMEPRVFNDLWRFFSRYYDQGDFLTERRYSSRGAKYSVPYNGEEVLLHWANRDQYYVKTSERFTDYRFKTGGYTIWFRLHQAETPQDNVKGDKRYFVRHDEVPLVYDEETQTLTIPFAYRPLGKGEEDHYVTMHNNLKAEDKSRLKREYVCETLENRILDELGNTKLKATLTKATSESKRSILYDHLNRYTARQTMDYFVHKDLGGFLRRELDVFLKTEVMRLGDLMADERGEMALHLLTRMRIVRHIAHGIIDFLAQIENFQKRLFEKRKFVVQTDYCLTLDRVPEELYPEILANEAQVEEWRQLYRMEEWEENLFWQGEFDEGFLSNHPYLMVDTAFFDQDFKIRLLATFDDLDGEIDGVLIHGENYQALNLLKFKYKEKIKCIHIDPPYNTESSGFLYKNNYQHSSWLSMMEQTHKLAILLLHQEGILQCHIDEYELERLHLLFERHFTLNAGTLVWDKGTPVTGAHGLATQHEYVLCRTKNHINIRVDKENVQRIKRKVSSLIREYGGATEEALREYRAWLRSDTNLSKSERTYTAFDDSGKVFRSDNMSATDERTDDKFYVPLIHPITNQPCPIPSNGWRYTPQTMQQLLEDNLILFGEDHTTIPRRKTLLEDTKSSQMSSVYFSGHRGKFELDRLGVEFPFAHPSEFYSYLIKAITTQTGDLVLDFFAGSGTTAHAVMDLNRDDGGERKYILVEMGDYFDTVLKPRILKVAFSSDWKDGVPQDRDGMSHMVKYQRLESYEDALNNIKVDKPAGSQLELLRQFDDYMLHYMLDFETRGSQSLLAQEAFEKPFDYTLKIQRGHESPENTTVDLVETFHYLIGMHVRKIERYEHQDRPYLVSRGDVRTERGYDRVITIWRDTEDLDLEQEADWVNEEILTELADRVYVNGYKNFINQAEPTEITFRKRMEAEIHGA